VAAPPHPAPMRAMNVITANISRSFAFVIADTPFCLKFLELDDLTEPRQLSSEHKYPADRAVIAAGGIAPEAT